MRGHGVHEVGDYVLSTRAFSTRLGGDQTDRVRTRGRVMSVPAAGAWSSTFSVDTVPAELLDSDAAYGKVAVLREARGVTETASFQVTDTADDAAIVACANATAAAAACHSLSSGNGRVSLGLALPADSDARIVADVRHRNAGSSVRQVWEGVRIHLAADTVVDGRHVAVCAGALEQLPRGAHPARRDRRRVRPR